MTDQTKVVMFGDGYTPVLEKFKDMGDGTYAEVTAAAIASGVAVATIAAGATGLSDGLDIGGMRLARVVMPAAWVAAALTFQTSYDGVNYSNLYDSTGVEYTVQAAASRAIIIPFADFFGVRFLKVRSGTSAAPVNQTANRTLTLVLAA